MGEPLIAFDRIGHAYRAGEWVLRELSGTVSPRSILAVLGPNGTGKTTLLRILSGALSPSEGKVVLTSKVALVPQLFEVAFDYSVLDMVLMGRADRIGRFGQPGPADREAALAALDRLGIASLAGRSFNTLSGGQRQLVLLARTIVTEARIVLLDEPCAALDLRNQEQVLRWMKRLAMELGAAVIFTTHNPQHALEIADATLLMTASGYILDATRNVLTGENLRSAFDVAFHVGPLVVGGRAVATPMLHVLD